MFPSSLSLGAEPLKVFDKVGHKVSAHLMLVFVDKAVARFCFEGEWPSWANSSLLPSISTLGDGT